MTAVAPSPAAAAVGTVDDGGANDANGQNDLTRFSFDDTDPDFLEINWSWDEPSAITGGGQAVNACAMFDTDGDGNVNYSLCVEVSEDKDPLSPTFGQLVVSTPDPPNGSTWFPHWIECSDGKDDRCTQPNRLGDPVDLPAGLGATTCSVAVTATDPFDATATNGPGDDYPDDIEATCLLDTSLLPAAGSYEFVNVCSYPSAAKDGNNDPSDCVLEPGSGFLTIVKVADPDDDTVFNFSLSPASTAGDSQFSITGSGTIERIPVFKSGGPGGAGNYTLLEAVPADWQLDTASCTTNGTGTGTATTSLPAVGAVDAGVGGIEILPGQETVCTFTNERSVVAPVARVVKGAEDGNDNIASLAEPGGSVTIAVTVFNDAEPVVGDATLTSLTDDLYGDITAVQDSITSTSCTTGGVIAGGGSYSCSFTIDVAAEPSTITDEVEAVLTNDAGSATDTDQANVVITDVAPTVTLTKSASPETLPEPGGEFTYTLTITNTSAETVTIVALTDTQPLSADCQALVDDAVELAANGGAASCTYAVQYTEPAVYPNTAGVTVEDNDGTQASTTADESVTVTDVPPTVTLDKSVTPTTLPEPGGVFTYTLEITNTSDEEVEIISLTDDHLLSAECADLVGTFVPAGEMVTCSYTVTQTDPGTYDNTASVIVEDNDGSQGSASAAASVTVTDALPTVVLTKTVDVETLPEPGGDFTYTLKIDNTSVEDVSITALVDSNPLSADCLALVGTTLAANSSTSCTYVVNHSDAGVYPNVARVDVEDDELNPASATDNLSVEVTDVLPTVTLDKSVDVAELDEPGGTFTYSLAITNTSVEPVEIDSLVDDHDLSQDCIDLLGASILAGETVTCSYAVELTVPGVYPNSATVTVSDNEDNTASATDNESVTVNDVPPTVTLDKSVDVDLADEPGGTFTYTLLITNTSNEDVTITKLVDDYPLSTECQGLVDDVVAANGGTASCIYAVDHLDAGVYNNTATVTVEDDDGSTADADDDATVTITDVAPLVDLVKSVDPASLEEPGGTFTYSLAITNNSVEDVTVDELTDTHTLSQECLELVNMSVSPGQTVSCDYTVDYSEPGTYDNSASVVVSDNEDNSATDSDEATVEVTNAVPVIVVDKAGPATVAEGGATATYTVTITNNSVGNDPVTITSLGDDKFGDLLGEAQAANGDNPIVIQPGHSFSFNFDRSLDLNGGEPHTNTVTALGVDDENTEASDSDDHTVTGEDVAPAIEIVKDGDAVISEGGDTATYSFVIANNSGSSDPVTITSLIDDRFGDLLAEAEAINGGSPIVIQPGDNFSFDISRSLSLDGGDSHTNQVTVIGVDDEGTTATDDDDHTVLVADVAPIINVTKEGPGTVNEGGDTATYTVSITNNSAETDPVTITSLIDDKFGDLLPEAEAANGDKPIVLAPGDTFTFGFDRPLTLNSGEEHLNTVEACGFDDEAVTRVCAGDDHLVTGDDVPPVLDVIKSGDATINEGGDTAIYKITISNNSVFTDPVTVTSLSDDKFGDLLGEAEAANGGAPIVLAPDASFSFEFDRDLTLNSGETHANTATVCGVDDETTPACDDDGHVVTGADVAPAINVDKTGPDTLNEGGGTATYTVTVTNKSVSTDPVTVTSLEDDKFGDLLAEAETANGGNRIVLAPKESFSFSFDRDLTVDADEGHTNVATACGVDDETTETCDDDDHTVTGENVEPKMSVSKTPSQDEVFAPGEDVVFTIRVVNDSVSTDPLTVISIVDDVFGDVSAECVLPQTIAPRGAFECDIARPITADHTNTVTVTAEDDEGTKISDFDDASVTYSDPSLTIEKSTGPQDADTAPGPEILVGETVNWFYQVTNDGDVALTDLTVTDDQGVTVSCATSSLSAGASTVCEGSGTATEGQYANIGTATASYTDADDDIAKPTASDPSHYFGATPSVDVVKEFADDSVIAGGTGSSFDLVVTNNGNVDLENVSVFDAVDSRLTVTGVSGTAGVDNDSDGDAQTVEWLISNLAVDEAVTITVDFTVASSVEEADGPGGVNDDPAVSNTATATSVYTDDVDNSTTVDDDGSDTIGVVTSADLRVEKTDAFDPILAGNQVTYTVTVHNDGPSDADNVIATDTLPAGVILSSTSGCQEDPAGLPTCSLGTIAAGESAGYDIVVDVAADTAGTITNSVTVTSEDPDPNGGNNSAEEETLIAAPLLSITKTFADDAVIAGGTGSSFDLVVTNNGNVDLSGVSITDVVDDRLTVTGVASADADCAASTDQNIDCTTSLPAGESATVTVDFSVAPDTAEADGVGGLNDEDPVSNTATVANTYTDDAGNTADLNEEASDTVDIKVDIDLSIVKTFSPSEVSQGTVQSFNLVVTNNGPSDAVDVSVTDLVDDSILVAGVSSVPNASGGCDDSSGQSVDCTLQIPAGDSVTITVDYTAAPFLDGSSGNLGGDDFRFVFVNGSVLEGSTATGEVFLDGLDVSGEVTIISGLSRNDVIFDPPGPDPAFELHLSCSDPFTGGWGQSGGPVEGVDTNWQIAYFSIARFNNNGLIKNCGNVTNPFDVPNTATASGEDSFGVESASFTATLTIGPGITLDRLQTNGKRLTVRLTNFTGDDKIIDQISAVWPSSNGDLTKIRLDEPTVWQGNDAPPSALLDATDSGWIGGTLLTGDGILRFDFANKSAKAGYTIRLTFTDGTFLDINQ